MIDLFNFSILEIKDSLVAVILVYNTDHIHGRCALIELLHRSPQYKNGFDWHLSLLFLAFDYYQAECVWTSNYRGDNGLSEHLTALSNTPLKASPLPYERTPI